MGKTYKDRKPKKERKAKPVKKDKNELVKIKKEVKG